MAGIEWIWVRGSDAEFIGMGKKLEEQIMKAVAAAMPAIIANAVAMAKSLSADRVLTGAMISAIEGEVRASAAEIGGRFGFLGSQQDYFIFQTVTGFHHWLGGDFIEATFALRDSGLRAQAELVAAIHAAIAGAHL